MTCVSIVIFWGGHIPLKFKTDFSLTSYFKTMKKYESKATSGEPSPPVTRRPPSTRRRVRPADVVGRHVSVLFDDSMWYTGKIVAYSNGHGKIDYVCDNKPPVNHRIHELDETGGKVDYHRFSFCPRHGATYNGPWKGGLRDGHGVMAYADGRTYDGQWKRGKREGNGVMTFADGRTYDGRWKRGKREGRGVLTFPSGTTYDGQWKHVRWPMEARHEKSLW